MLNAKLITKQTGAQGRICNTVGFPSNAYELKAYSPILIGYACRTPRCRTRVLRRGSQ